MRDLKGVTVYRDGSKNGQILVPISREEAEKAMNAKNIETVVDEATVQCSSGSCEL
jgi:hypothetical protein